MNQHENAAIVVELVRQLRDNGSWCGVTHLQKAAYFLKTLTRVPLSADFILYKHGPYASEFQSLVNHMLVNRLLERVPRQPPYGPSLSRGPRADLLAREHGSAANEFSREIGFISDRLATKGVVDLEKLGTALWVTENTGAETPEQRAREMVERKPHIIYEDALATVRELEAIREDWDALPN